MKQFNLYPLYVGRTAKIYMGHGAATLESFGFIPKIDRLIKRHMSADDWYRCQQQKSHHYAARFHCQG